MSNRLDQERELSLQPQRMAFAKEKIEGKGYKVTYEDMTRLEFDYMGYPVKIYPYSGWFTGKGVKDGRGLQNLLAQI